ncbi:NAD(P)/FAD-dependent oxidoreductase [Myroides marinus]|uniref:phytoene desaturase family protein n=1 Tax=Myroides marinus TaxID=703342 RepID=UPI0025763EE8|nr:NAD(P)/FAD-dependent oxidoreductase [Myroides marinus]MDM1367472.1 NAD(P)/FAD-dependent oxidoreductase [Myroides marinus]MDM1370936.1 NAD(P)/FAD-dependent oxidoreductase [Myroides marinus]MDM1373971.1 NAD(P)/FAD-dependent oxidoreductase [Myroides marinus]MDM1382993.1 NAD(P)/FAD-dependent oxidoreductase [Myroides marinus]MDM1388444.1 NAD(P)/FAD-dependent oxidoreductase [Myroides marinus]
MEKKYDVVVIGSGLGGLASAVILAKEGKKVCVLEKNTQYGGNLQTFSRDKSVFDTGVHYIGGLDKGENLYKYFSYLEIMDMLKLHRLDSDGYDMISFEGEGIEYPHAQGYENFVQQLLIHFPNEEEALREYCDKINDICHRFPMYNLEDGKGYDDSIVSIKLSDFLDEITTDEKLKAVLIGSNFLYVADKERTPLYVHALTINSYIQSAWRCVHGGSQISRALIKVLKSYGGEIYKHKEVVGFTFDNQQLASCYTSEGEHYYGEQFVSNINLKHTIRMVGAESFSKPFVKRIMSLEEVPSVFSLYIVFKKDAYPYQNSNIYHYNSLEDVWDTHSKSEGRWPNLLVASMNCTTPTQKWADSMTVMTYMDYEEVKQWKDTYNVSTIKQLGSRGESYEAFKQEKERLLLAKLESKYPGICDAIQSVHSSTPLSYRDFIGSEGGNMYGFVKDANSPMKTFISPRSKIGNLFFSGQNVRMHGVMGVTIGAFVTCLEMVDKGSLMTKLNKFRDDEVLV